MDALQLHHPFTSIIAGPTGSGKSYFVRDVLKQRKDVIHPAPDHTVWFYGVYQSLYDEIPDVTFVEGIPSNFRDHIRGKTLFIIDDLMAECGSDTKLSHLFTRGSHHWNLSVIFIAQNIFHKGKEMREISLNAHYLFLFKSRRDVNQVVHLGRQLYPSKTKFFQEVYLDATKKPYGYLLVDLKPETNEDLRLRTNILPGQTQIVYQPR